MIVKLLTEHHLEFLSLKRGCRGSSEPTFVKMSNCWKSHAAAQIIIFFISLAIDLIFANSAYALKLPFRSFTLLYAFLVPLCINYRNKIKFKLNSTYLGEMYG